MRTRTPLSFRPAFATAEVRVLATAGVAARAVSFGYLETKNEVNRNVSYQFIQEIRQGHQLFTNDYPSKISSFTLGFLQGTGLQKFQHASGTTQQIFIKIGNEKPERLNVSTNVHKPDAYVFNLRHNAVITRKA